MSGRLPLLAVLVAAACLGGEPGPKNLARLTPDLYRGGQPDGKGLDHLKALGVKTVLNLRHDAWKEEEAACRERGLTYVHIGLHTSTAPAEADVKRFLEVLADPKLAPVFVHCLHGSDRTGALVAVWRRKVQGWSLEEALKEMDAFGFSKEWKKLRAFVEGYKP